MERLSAHACWQCYVHWRGSEQGIRRFRWSLGHPALAHRVLLHNDNHHGSFRQESRASCNMQLQQWKMPVVHSLGSKGLVIGKWPHTLLRHWARDRCRWRPWMKQDENRESSLWENAINHVGTRKETRTCDYPFMSCKTPLGFPVSFSNGALV